MFLSYGELIFCYVTNRLKATFQMYNVKKFFGKKDAKKFRRVKMLLRLAQLATSNDEFTLLLQKTFIELGDEYEEFKQWFATYSTGPLANWYEGFGFVCTNNGLEATNNVIKNENTERVLHTVSSFLPVMLEIANDWTIHSKDWITSPIFDSTCYSVGYQFWLYFKECFDKKSDNEWLFTARNISVHSSVSDAVLSGMWPDMRTFDVALKYCH